MTRFTFGMVGVLFLLGLLLWAAPEQPEEKASADQIVGKAALLRGEEYITARDEIVKMAADDDFLKKIEETARDEKNAFPERSVAEICLLRLKNPVAAEDMRNRMREHIRGVLDGRYLHESILPPAELLVKHDPLNRLQQWEEQREHPGAAAMPVPKATTRDELLLAGELLLYGTDSSIREDLGELWPEDEKDYSAKVKNPLVPFAAKVQATWYILFSDDPAGVSILAHWEPTGLRPDLLAKWRWKCLSAIAHCEDKPVENRKQAIVALGRKGADTYAVGVLIVLSRNDKDPEIRAAAAEALKQIEAKEPEQPAPVENPDGQ